MECLNGKHCAHFIHFKVSCSTCIASSISPLRNVILSSTWNYSRSICVTFISIMRIETNLTTMRKFPHHPNLLFEYNISSYDGFNLLQLIHLPFVGT